MIEEMKFIAIPVFLVAYAGNLMCVSRESAHPNRNHYSRLAVALQSLLLPHTWTKCVVQPNFDSFDKKTPFSHCATYASSSPYSSKCRLQNQGLTFASMAKNPAVALRAAGRLSSV